MTYYTLFDTMIVQLKAAKDLKRSVIHKLVKDTTDLYISTNPEYQEVCDHCNTLQEKCLILLRQIKVGQVRGNDLVV